MSIAKIVKILTLALPILTGVDVAKVKAVIEILQLIAEDEG